MTVELKPLNLSTTIDLELPVSSFQPKIAHGPQLREDLERMGTNFYRAYPVLDTHRFGYLLTAIDGAEEEWLHTREKITAIR